MRKLNHYAISAILGSEIVGRVNVGHGMIASAADAQRYFDTLEENEPIADQHRNEEVDVELVKRAFFAVRHDQGSTDLYIADPVRNSAFLAECRRLGMRASDYRINKTLFNARKNKLLTGLESDRTSIDYEDFAFASEFAATQLRYRTGASIDDILCDPPLAARFDKVAQRITPGHSSFEYRWAILSIRKAALHKKLPATFRMPRFGSRIGLFEDPIEQVPNTKGLYLLYEREKLLYARSTEHLRHGIEIHRDRKVFDAIAEKLWQPEPAELGVEYAAMPSQGMTTLQAIERRIVEERHPVFNVPRMAA
jgi:site-specific DNA-methyltransferase (adenine-specific)